MDNAGDRPASNLIRAIRADTERLIRIFDQYFLRTCGIAPLDDLDEIRRAIAENPLPAALRGAERHERESDP